MAKAFSTIGAENWITFDQEPTLADGKIASRPFLAHYERFSWDAKKMGMIHFHRIRPVDFGATSRQFGDGGPSEAQAGEAGLGTTNSGGTVPPPNPSGHPKIRPRSAVMNRGPVPCDRIIASVLALSQASIAAAFSGPY